MEDKGLVRVERRGSGRANHYRLVRDESAGKIQALEESKRSEYPNSGVRKIHAQAFGESAQNQTDTLNQTHKETSCPNSEARRLSELLLSEIQKRKPDFKRPDLKAWSRHIDLMLRRDKRTPERIERVIVWVQADPFWQNNVLSAAKLRERFDQLELKMGNTKNGTGYCREFDQQRSCIGTTVRV